MKRSRLKLPPAEYKKLTTTVFQRDGWRCRVCGAGNSLHSHHVRFRSDGGPDSSDNLLTVCGGPHSCHDKIHGLVPGEFYVIIAKSGDPDEVPNCDEGVKVLRYGAVTKRKTWNTKKGN